MEGGMDTDPQQPVSFLAPEEADDESGHLHRQLVGYLGMLLPPLVWLIASWRSVQGPKRWDLLTSISAYYYTGAVAAFTGILVALAVFFFTYRGYANEFGRRDRVAAFIAGCAALLVAFFPTKATVPTTDQDWWAPSIGAVHGISASILFLDFAFFALVLFPKSRVPGAATTVSKRVRNVVYYGCGALVLLCIAWAGIALWMKASIFWAEALALEFFALSWLAKGRAEWTAWQALRHPVQLMAKVQQAIRGVNPGQG